MEIGEPSLTSESSGTSRTRRSTSTEPRVHIYLRFEVYNPRTDRAEPLPAGSMVELVDWNAIADEAIDARPVGEDGQVHFSEAREAVKGADVYFSVCLSRLRRAGYKMPRRWSTKGWKALDGTPGYHPDFAGGDIGSAGAPVVFRVGMDFHARLQYENKNDKNNLCPAPKGVGIAVVCGNEVRSQRDYTPPKDQDGRTLADRNMNPSTICRTDDKGEIHGLFFGARPGRCSFQVLFDIEDPEINLPRARVETPIWSIDIPENDETTVGAPAAPIDVKCQLPPKSPSGVTKKHDDVFNACVALYILKTLRELSVFLFHVTGGADDREYVRKAAWKGVKGLTYYLRTHVSFIDVAPYSWPVGSVWMTTDESIQWSRSTIIHETAHQVMWKEVDWSTLGIGYQAVFGNLQMEHDVHHVTNPMHALIEGWAEFLEFLFDGCTPLISNLYDTKGHKLPTPFSAQLQSPGERVEGAFASALVDLALTDLATGTPDIVGGLPKSKDGDVTKTAPKIADRSFGDRFRQLIWYPLKDLKFAPERTTTELVTRIARRNESDWPRIHKRLMNAAFRIAEPPKVTEVSRRNGPTDTGTWITVKGEGFANDASVTFAGQPAAAVYVRGQTRIEVLPPQGLPRGPVDVEVATPYRGTGRLVGGYTYP